MHSLMALFLTSDLVVMIGVFFSLLVSIALLFEKRGNPTLRILLTIIFLGLSSYYSAQILILSGYVIYIPLMIRFFTPFFVLVPPAIYFYVIVNLNEDYKFTWIDLLHGLPFFIFLVDNIPYYLDFDHCNYQLALSISKDFRALFHGKGLMLPIKFNFIFRTTQFIIYVSFAWRYYIQHIYRYKPDNEKLIRKWLFVFLILISVFVITILATTINGIFVFTAPGELETVRYKVSFPLYFVGICLIGMSTFTFFNPHVLFGVPRIQFNPSSVNNDSLNKVEIETHDVKTEKLDLIKDINIAISLVQEIQKLELYLQPDWSVQKASQHFKLPMHHLSYLFNQCLNKSFPEVIGAMRVNHSIELLRNDSGKKYTMEAIGKLSGFQSRTTFYNNFKKYTGITPQEYLNQIGL